MQPKSNQSIIEMFILVEYKPGIPKWLNIHPQPTFIKLNFTQNKHLFQINHIKPKILVSNSHLGN